MTVLVVYSCRAGKIAAAGVDVRLRFCGGAFSHQAAAVTACFAATDTCG